MSNKKIYYGMLGLVSIIAFGFFSVIIVGNNVLKSSSAQLQELKLKDRILQEKQTALLKAKQDIEKYQDFEETAKSVVPQDKDQAKAVRQIINLAKQSGIKIQSISFSASSLGGSGATPSSGQNQNPDAPGAKKPTTSSNKAISQAVPVTGVNGVYSLEMIIIPDTEEGSPITYTQFLDFLQKLENNRRTAQVTQIRVDPVDNESGSPYVDFSLTVNIFLKP